MHGANYAVSMPVPLPSQDDGDSPRSTFEVEHPNPLATPTLAERASDGASGGATPMLKKTSSDRWHVAVESAMFYDASDASSLASVIVPTWISPSHRGGGASPAHGHYPNTHVNQDQARLFAIGIYTIRSQRYFKDV